MQMTLVWSFRNRVTELEASVTSAHKTCGDQIDFLLVDANSSLETIQSVQLLRQRIPTRNIRVVESFRRTTLVQAWNLGLMLSTSPFIIFASSDTYFKAPGWANAFRDNFTTGAHYVLIENHALFAISRTLTERIGWFDEAFGNGPHFDPDFMIRSTEAGVNPMVSENKGWYSHGDDPKVTALRLNTEVPDRLPMNTFQNEEIFKSKWSSKWMGWKDSIHRGELHLPHPPTNIRDVIRLRPEVNWHPSFSSAIPRLPNSTPGS